MKDPLILSEPQGFQQKVHVDIDYKWSGENPNQQFELQEELGKGYGKKSLHLLMVSSLLTHYIQ